MSDNEYNIKNCQTVAGVPNEINICTRQDTTGRSIEKIKADDNDYIKGISSVRRGNKKEKNQLIKEIEDDDGWDDYEPKQELEDLDGFKKHIRKVHKKWVNPQTIKAAIKKHDKYNYKQQLCEGLEKCERADPPLPDKPPTPPTNKEVGDF